MPEQIPGWAQEIRERIVRIETMVSNSANTQDKADAADARSKENQRRINKLEDSYTWLWRSIIAAIIVGTVESIFSLAGYIH